MASSRASRRASNNQAVWTFGGATRDYRVSGGFGTLATWESDAGTADLTTGMSQVVVSNNSAGRFRLGEALAFSASSATATCFGQSADRGTMYYKVLTGTPTTADTITGGTTGATCDIDSITSTNTGVTLVLDCYADAASYDIDNVTFSGCTTSSTYRRVVRAAATARHGGVPGVGVHLTSTTGAATGMLTINEANVSLEDLQISRTYSYASETAAVFVGAVAGVELVGLLISGTNVGAGVFSGILAYNDQAKTIANCIIYECEGNGMQIRNTSTRVLNCTVVNCTGTGYTYFGSQPIWINCLGYNNTAADFSGAGTAGTTHNLSKDATAPGATNYRSKTITFVDEGVDDYRLTNDADAVGQGTDLSGDTFPFSDDIAYTERGATWDVGAFEYVSAATSQPLAKRHGGILHTVGASPLGSRRW